MRLFFFVVLAFASAVLAADSIDQKSLEEAQARLKHRQEERLRAATQPAVVADLLAQVELLKAKVAALTTENTSLKRKLEQAIAVKEAPKPEATKKLLVGMTLEEANKAMGSEGKLLGAEVGDIERYSWTVIDTDPRPQQSTMPRTTSLTGTWAAMAARTAAPAPTKTIYATFRKGKIVSFDN